MLSSWLTSLKPLERKIRLFSIRFASLLLGVRSKKVVLSEHARILVVRLDERVGNMILLTPLLGSLRARYPHARIHLLGHRKTQHLMAQHPWVDAFIAFDKKKWFSAHGPFATFFKIKTSHYDLAIDAGNPTDPSVTQSFMVRLSGATHTVGVAHGLFAALYSAPAPLTQTSVHEIDLRLSVLSVLPKSERVFEPYMPHQPVFHHPDIERLMRVHGLKPMAIVNVGARLKEKQLDAHTYAKIATRVADRGCIPLITWGPKEYTLAQSVVSLEERAVMAPETNLQALAWLMQQACCVITCDTGPMHLSVALGTPTCGLFVSTPPERYGYTFQFHTCFDVRNQPLDMHVLQEWLEKVVPCSRA